MSPLKVLIIEDEFLILKSLQIMFERRGHKVDTTTSGTEGLKKIIESDFDIIITDLMLNDISGFDILEGSLKKYERKFLPETFVIISAYSSEQILSKVQSYECLFIRKPFGDINSTVDEIIKRFIKE